MIEVSRELQGLDDRTLIDLIREEKRRRGPELMILGHHYQRHGIIEIADHIGDSFGLAKIASQAPAAKDIVFCGVRFMAESAAILCRDDQSVYHPEPEAGCPMADMAPMDSVERAWKLLHERADLKGRQIIPVTYMNSHAPLKAFTGANGGVVCTSSNAQQVMDWAWNQGDIVFFFPDEKLGRNTATAMGVSDQEMCLWYPSRDDIGMDDANTNTQPTTLDDKRVILWNGHCPVHMKFTSRDVRFVRKHFPQAKIIVHPECEKEVVDLADASGSTSYIVEYVASLAAQGNRPQVFVGTEINLVERLKTDFPQVRVEALFRSLCPTMYMVNVAKVYQCLKVIGAEAASLKDELLVPMPSAIKAPAKLSLERMLALQGFVAGRK